MWWDTDWLYRRRVVVTNRGGALSGHTVRLRLDGSRFDFSKSAVDGSDLRVLSDDQATVLSHWVESWDSVGKAAVVWGKVPSLVSGDSVIWLYYGSSGAVSTSDPANSLLLWEDFSAATLSNYTQSAGAWTIVSDIDRGDVLNSAVSGVEAHLYKASTIEGYVAELWTKRTSVSGVSDGALGLLVDMVDTSNYYKPSFRTQLTDNIRVRQVLGGVATDINKRTVTPANLNEWVRDVVIYKQATSLNSSSALTGVKARQGLATDGAKLYTTTDTELCRYDFSGVLEESTSDRPTGTTNHFGGLTVHNGDLYVAFIDSGVSPKVAKVLRYDPSNLAGGFTEVADLTSDVGGASTINSIVYKDGYWIVGETGGGVDLSTQRFFVYDSDWSLKKTVYSPYAHDRGAQDATFKGNVMYVMQHDGWYTAFAWDPVNIEFTLVDAGDGALGLGGEGIEWDEVNARWYFNTVPNNTNGTVAFGQLEEIADRRVVYYAKGGVGGVGLSSGVTVADFAAFTQASIGVGAFRDGRFDDLAVRPYALDEPFAAVSVTEQQVQLVVVGSMDDVAGAVWGHAGRYLSDVDGVTDLSLREALLAYLAGKSDVVDNGDGTKTLTYKKQDGVTSKLQITFNNSGEFTATQVV